MDVDGLIETFRKLSNQLLTSAEQLSHDQGVLVLDIATAVCQKFS